MRSPLRLKLGDIHLGVRLVGNSAPFTATLESENVRPGVELVTLKLRTKAPAVPPPLTIEWDFPVVDVAAIWTSVARRNKGIPLADDLEVDPLLVRSTSGAPVAAIISSDGRNRLTFAFADAMNPSLLTAGLFEELAAIRCGIGMFVSASEPSECAEAKILIDARDLAFEQVLADVAQWWTEQPGYEPAPVPAETRLLVYSTWTAFHQDVAFDRVLKQARLAKRLGCEAVILDDGWQTLDSTRGYAHTGDWQPSGIPDLAELVQRVHKLGLKFLLWYSMPDVGFESEAYARFRDQILYSNQRRRAAVLDPRFPEVRAYLIQLYERAVREWDVDGLKLDFVDRFGSVKASAATKGDGRDITSVERAVDQLMKELLARLRSLKPNIMVEFRQPYTGPLMRVYGNMLRALDCPTDHVLNRVSTIDLRLLSGSTAVHSDMLFWRPDNPVERAALQLLSVLFSVPQISVRLDRLPADHLEMLEFWLKFWGQNRAVLLDGQLRARSPELNYPLVTAETEERRIAAAYADVVVPVRPSTYVVNAKPSAGIVIDVGEPFEAQVATHDVCGRVVERRQSAFAVGPHRINVPPAGLVAVESAP